MESPVQVFLKCNKAVSCVCVCVRVRAPCCHCPSTLTLMHFNDKLMLTLPQQSMRVIDHKYTHMDL